MNILSIGNSFSQDAQAYVKGVFEAAGVEALAANLYIGGCTLVRHWNNAASDIADYELEINGQSVGRNISIREALDMCDWDVITLQESSARSVEIGHFTPYLPKLAEYIRARCKKAKIALMQTWGYNDEKLHVIKNLGFSTPEAMFDASEKCYAEAKEMIGADLIIPAGKAIKNLYMAQAHSHRDGQHASLGLGRYTLALTWLKALCGIEATGNSFRDFSEELTDEQIKLAWESADNAF